MEEDPFAKLSITFVRVVMILGGETDPWFDFFCVSVLRTGGNACLQAQNPSLDGCANASMPVNVA